MTTRVLLADDNSDLRSALRLVLEKRLDESAIIEADNMEQVLAQVEDACPHCIVLDWELPGRPKRERIRVLRTLVPALHIVVTSARPEAREEALASGADQFAAKSDSPTTILDAIRSCCTAEE